MVHLPFEICSLSYCARTASIAHWASHMCKSQQDSPQTTILWIHGQNKIAPKRVFPLVPHCVIKQVYELILYSNFVAIGDSLYSWDKYQAHAYDVRRHATCD